MVKSVKQTILVDWAVVVPSNNFLENIVWSVMAKRTAQAKRPAALNSN